MFLIPMPIRLQNSATINAIVMSSMRVMRHRVSVLQSVASIGSLSHILFSGIKFQSMRLNNCRHNRLIASMQFNVLVFLLELFLPIGSQLLAFPGFQDTSTTSKPLSDSVSELVSATGVVVDESDNPIANAVVYLRESSVQRDNENADGWGSIFNAKRNYTFAKTKSDSLGRFAFNQINSPASKAKHKVDHFAVVAKVAGRPQACYRLVSPNSKELVRLVIPEKGTSIGGIVCDSSGQPVSEVQVYVDEISRPNSRKNQSLNSADQFVFRNSSLTPRATTDLEGKFSIPNLPLERRVGIAFVHNNYVPRIEYVATTEQPQPPLQAPRFFQGKSLMNSYPIQSGEMLVKLGEGHRLKGRIVDTNDEGVAHQKFEIIQHSDSGESERLTTDDDGRFASLRFREPKVRLRIRIPNNQNYVAFETDFQFKPQETEREVVYRLPVPQTIRGTLKSEDSEPVPHARIVFIPSEDKSSSALWKSTTTAMSNESGEFEMRVAEQAGVLAPVGPAFGFELGRGGDIAKFRHGELNSIPDTWRQVDPSDFEEVSAQDQTKKVARVDLLVKPSLVVSGKIISDNGEPAAQASIRVVNGVFNFEGPFRGLRRNEIEELFHTTSDDQGNFQIRGVPRNLDAVFAVNDSSNTKVALVYVDQLTTLKDVQVKLTDGVVLSGKVMLDGQPRPDTTIFLSFFGPLELTEDGKPTQEQFQWGQVETDKAGAYRFSGVPVKSSYYVAARIDYKTEESQNPRLVSEDLHLKVPVFDFKSLKSTIAGIVVDPAGNPIAGIEVYRMSSSRSPAYSKPDGTFKIGGLPSDTLITLTANVQREIDGDRIFFRMPAKIEVMSGDQNVRIVLDPRLAKKLRKIQKPNVRKIP